jgi:hypothetical protein
MGFLERRQGGQAAVSELKQDGTALMMALIAGQSGEHAFRALNDNQLSELEAENARLKAEVERLTKAGDLMCRMAGNNQVINRHWKTAKGVQS